MLVRFWCDFDAVFVRCWRDFCSMLVRIILAQAQKGHLWDQFGRRAQVDFGSILVRCWFDFGPSFVRYWFDFGSILIRVWFDFYFDVCSIFV